MEVVLRNPDSLVFVLIISREGILPEKKSQVFITYD